MASKSEMTYLRNLASDGCKAAILRLNYLEQLKNSEQRFVANIKNGAVEIPSAFSLEDERAFEFYAEHPELIRA